LHLDVIAGKIKNQHALLRRLTIARGIMSIDEIVAPAPSPQVVLKPLARNALRTVSATGGPPITK
jgi:hypothetical protein